MQASKKTLARRALELALLLAAFVACIEGLQSAQAWWKDGASSLAAHDWLLVALLPVWLTIYVRRFSIFRCRCPRGE